MKNNILSLPFTNIENGEERRLKLIKEWYSSHLHSIVEGTQEETRYGYPNNILYCSYKTQQRTTLDPQPALVFRSGVDCTQRMNNLIKETSLQERLPSSTREGERALFILESITE